MWLLALSLLNEKDYTCWVVAPSLMPRKAGDRVKTQRRDAMPLARLARSGALAVVAVPQVDEEAMRDLTRARADTLSALQAPQCRRKAFLLRHDRRYTGRATGGPAPLRWLSEVVWPTPAPPSGFQAYVRAVPEPTARRQRLAQERHEHGQAWRLAPVVEALQALRGVHCTVAGPLGAAMGARPRLDSPRARMKGLGLMPSEDASGDQRRQGPLPKAGTPQARRVLVAGAWAYRSPAPVRRHWPLRLATPPKGSPALRGQAQGSLCQRSRRLGSRGQHAHVGTGARARELTGFLWAMAQAGPIIASDAVGA